MSAQTNSDLTLGNVQPSQAGNYSVLVSNSVSTVISSNAALVVVVPVCTPPPSGMVAWWPGEGNANDIVGTNKGTVLVATNYRPGEVGQSFGMNGVGGAVCIPASPSLNVGLAGGMTLEAWIYPSNTSAQSLFEWSLDGNVGNYETHFWRGHPFYPTCNLFANIVDTNNVAHELYSFGPIISGTFEHVAMTYDKTTGIGRLFINSQIVNETLLGTFTPKTKDTLYLGQRPPGDPYSNVFVGRIDEASIYNRALTTNEIASIYNSASAGKCTPCTPSPSGMVGWWPGEGNGNDIVGVNPAIIGAGVTYPPSEVGLGFLLNNPTNASFKIPKSSSLNVGLSAGFTVETWIKPSSVNGYHPIFEWFDEVAQVNGIQFWIGLDPSSQGVLAVAMLDANGNNFSLLSSPSGTLVSNAWQHVALTYDRGTHLIRLLVNGAVVAQSTWAGDVPRTGFNIWVGQHPTTCIGCSSAGVYLGGPLDELSLYNRALATNEIAVIYSAGSAGKCAVVNHPPVAGSIFTLGVKIGVPSTVLIIGGKHPPTDVDNDALTISSVAGAVNGSTSTDGTNVTYTATTGSTDSFNCTIDDGRGGTAIQTVNVAITANGGLGFNQLSPQSLGGGTNVLTFLGTPGFNYALERATNLVPPVLWRPQVTNVAKPNGFLIFTNVTSNSPVFYRTRYVP